MLSLATIHISCSNSCVNGACANTAVVLATRYCRLDLTSANHGILPSRGEALRADVILFTMPACRLLYVKARRCNNAQVLDDDII